MKEWNMIHKIKLLYETFAQPLRNQLAQRCPSEAVLLHPIKKIG